MKTTTLVFFGILLCIPVYINAQDEERTVATNEIRTGTLHILFSEFYLDYEKRINQHGFMVYGLAEDSHLNSTEKFGVEGGLQYRRYNLTPAEEDYYNWYTGLLTSYGYKTKKESGNSSTANYLRAGILIGVKLLITNKIIMDLSLAEIYQYSTAGSSPDFVSYRPELTGVGFSGFRLQVNCTVGIRF